MSNPTTTPETPAASGPATPVAAPLLAFPTGPRWSRPDDAEPG